MNGDEAAARSHLALLTHIDAALCALKDPRPSNEAIHAARKAIKKARAALRLLRYGLGATDYQKENVALRAAGRGLAALRDAKSLAEALVAVRRRHPDALPPADCQHLTKDLQAKLLARRRELQRRPATLRACVRTLTVCRTRLSRWDGKLDAGAGADGLRLIYRAGRKAIAAARQIGTAEALHEWRKQVKYLSNALRILDGSDRRSSKIEARAVKLADRLGEDHDLAELARYVAGRGNAVMTADNRARFTKLIARRRAILQKRAIALGAKLYDDKPKGFVRKFSKAARAGP